MTEATITIAGLPDKCPHCGAQPESWPLAVHHLRVVAECPACHIVAVPVRGIPARGAK